jgi:hypothetical protein
MSNSSVYMPVPTTLFRERAGFSGCARECGGYPGGARDLGR